MSNIMTLLIILSFPSVSLAITTNEAVRILQYERNKRCELVQLYDKASSEWGIMEPKYKEEKKTLEAYDMAIQKLKGGLE